MSSIKEIIARMTLEEKCSLLSGLDFWHTKSVDRLGVKGVMVSDGPHGLRKQDSAGDHLGINDSIKAVCFPAACATTASFDRDLVNRLGQAIGDQCQHEEVAVNLGPAINIKRSPLCGRNFEYMSEDPYLVAEMATSLIQGVQSRNIGVSVKHFAMNKPGSLDNVLAHTFPLLGNTLLLVDADLRIISIYSSQEGIVDIAKADLKEDLMAQARQEYLQTRNEREVFYRHIEGDCPRLIYNLFDEGEFVGILSLQEDAVPIRPCDADILKLLGDYVAKIFRHLGSKYSPHINRLSSVVSYLLHNNINPDNLRKSVHHAADYAGIGKEEEFLALVIHKPEDQADRYLPFFMHSLSVRVPGLVLETNELEDSVFILRYSLARSLGIDVEQTIEDYLQEFDFSAGISELYPDLADTRFYYRQAKIALMMAVSTDLKHVNAFSQYYANYLMNRLTSDMPPRVLYSRSFRNILELDKESTISYLETLRAFMKNHLSMTKTANALYISRNALLYRMEKIQTLMKECGEDLTNDVDYLRILTSFLMYDRYSESVNTADLH